MKVLMVTPYAPYRDGIAAYAVQEVRTERAAGTDIEVLSPLPSAAHHHLALGGVRGVLALVKRAAVYDRVLLQFSPEMLFGACRSPIQRVAVWGGLEALARRTRLEIRLHEIEYGPLERNPAERAMATRALRAAERVAVHTRSEVSELVARTGLSPDDIDVVDHGTSFTPATSTTQAEARADLGLADDVHVFLAIGFLQEHKGFDRAVGAFGRAGVATSAGAELHVVGSVRVDHPDLLAYARRLAARCQNTAGVTLHERYVSDSDFDRWIVAADTVVLPYREIWSSGVLERAKLYDRPVIASDVGGLGEQAPAGTILFADDESLAKAFGDRVGTTGPLRAGSPGEGTTASVEEPAKGWRVDPAAPDRAQVEAQMRERARAAQLGSQLGAGAAGAPGSALDPLLALGPVPRPHAVSARPGVSPVKRLIRRVVNWELDPIVAHVEALRRATIEAVTAVESARATDHSDRRAATSNPATSQDAERPPEYGR